MKNDLAKCEICPIVTLLGPFDITANVLSSRRRRSVIFVPRPVDLSCSVWKVYS